MAPQGYEDELLQHWFPAEQRTERIAFTEKDFREITAILDRAGQVTWSRIPRVYTVLRLIGRVDTIDCFVKQGITDTWFPFEQRGLPAGLHSHSDRATFLKTQKVVCNTKALDLEREHTGHRHFRDPNDVPLRKIGDLGKGASGFVERVISTITHREYALKRIRRGTTFRKDKRVLRDFENELSNLKTLSRGHSHIIELIGSFTEPKYVGIIFPVADCNLAELLNCSDLDDRRWSFRAWFGCLTSALGYLHDNNIRHKDIKPQNILISHDDQPLLTDFGVSIDWTEYGQSTTIGPTAMTPRYCAPEVAAAECRNSSSDIWSLGCVFLELWTALKGITMKELAEHFSIGAQVRPYHSLDVSISSWINQVSVLPSSASDNTPITWISHMLERDRERRWSAHLLVESIRDSSVESFTKYSYIGRCCLDDEETAESVNSDTDDSSDVTPSEASEVDVPTSAMLSSEAQSPGMVVMNSDTSQLLPGNRLNTRSKVISAIQGEVKTTVPVQESLDQDTMPRVHSPEIDADTHAIPTNTVIQNILAAGTATMTLLGRAKKSEVAPMSSFRSNYQPPQVQSASECSSESGESTEPGLPFPPSNGYRYSDSISKISSEEKEAILSNQREEEEVHKRKAKEEDTVAEAVIAPNNLSRRTPIANDADRDFSRNWHARRKNKQSSERKVETENLLYPMSLAELPPTSNDSDSDSSSRDGLHTVVTKYAESGYGQTIIPQALVSKAAFSATGFPAPSLCYRRGAELLYCSSSEIEDDCLEPVYSVFSPLTAQQVRRIVDYTSGLTMADEDRTVRKPVEYNHLFEVLSNPVISSHLEQRKTSSDDPLPNPPTRILELTDDSEYTSDESGFDPEISSRRPIRFDAQNPKQLFFPTGFHGVHYNHDQTQTAFDKNLIFAPTISHLQYEFLEGDSRIFINQKLDIAAISSLLVKSEHDRAIAASTGQIHEWTQPEDMTDDYSTDDSDGQVLSESQASQKSDVDPGSEMREPSRKYYHYSTPKPVIGDKLDHLKRLPFWSAFDFVTPSSPLLDLDHGIDIRAQDGSYLDSEGESYRPSAHARVPAKRTSRRTKKKSRDASESSGSERGRHYLYQLPGRDAMHVY